MILCKLLTTSFCVTTVCLGEQVLGLRAMYWFGWLGLFGYVLFVLCQWVLLCGSTAELCMLCVYCTSGFKIYYVQWVNWSKVGTSGLLRSQTLRSTDPCTYFRRAQRYNRAHWLPHADSRLTCRHVNPSKKGPINDFSFFQPCLSCRARDFWDPSWR